VHDAVDDRLAGFLLRVVRRNRHDTAVRRHEERHAERGDEVAGALDGREELERGDGLDLLPPAHDRASRTTRRKMSSMGARSGSKRSTAAPAATSALSTWCGAVPSDNSRRQVP